MTLGEIEANARKLHQELARVRQERDMLLVVAQKARRYRQVIGGLAASVANANAQTYAIAEQELGKALDAWGRVRPMRRGGEREP